MAYLCRVDVNKLVYEKVQLRHDQLLYYYEIEYLNSSSSYKRFNISAHNKVCKTYSGEVTKGSQKRIRQTVHKLLLLSPKKSFFNTVTNKRETMTINFMTLTIPKGKFSKDSKRAYTLLLKPFIRILKNKYQLTQYIWKAERQKNESIHYHLTTNVFIPYYRIKDEWNNLLAKNEYLTEFNKRYPNKTPNSTDIHKVYKINDIAAYLVKYISKSEPNKLPIEGKVWDCSSDLKQLKLPNTEVTEDIGKELYRMLLEKDLKEIDLEHSTLLKFTQQGKTKKKPKFVYELQKKITTESELLNNCLQDSTKNVGASTDAVTLSLMQS